MNRKTTTWIAAGLLLPMSAVPLLADDVTDVKSRLASMFPEVEAENVSQAPVNGLYQVALGTQVAYLSPDGRYLLQGDIYDLDTNENLTERDRGIARISALDSLGNETMLIFSPDEVKESVVVFTDIDCGYCRQLHSEMDAILERGIEVRYLLFPRGGPGTASWSKADNVWCSDDRNTALTRAKLGEQIEANDCGPTPVAEHYEMGRAVGVRGTPAILDKNGQMIGGYLPPDALAARLFGE